MSRRLENLINSFADRDIIWWPCLDLRPARHELFDKIRVVRIACVFGLLYTILIIFLMLLLAIIFRLPVFMRNTPVFDHFLLLSWLIVFTIYPITMWIVAPAWNARARRIQADVAQEVPPEVVPSAPISP